MDRWKEGQMENLPILQHFVPYRGRCPKGTIDVGNYSMTFAPMGTATLLLNEMNTDKQREAGQGNL